jgi:hypothetical protein
MFTFMSAAPACFFDALFGCRFESPVQYRHDRPRDASGLAADAAPWASDLQAWSTKALDRVGPGIGERRLPGYHFRQQAAGGGAEG